MTPETRNPAWEAFTRAALADDDLGYPNNVTFVSGTSRDADEMVWASLRERRSPTVIVFDDAEILLTPNAGPIGRLRDALAGRVSVTVQWRRDHVQAQPMAVQTRVGHHVVSRMRALAHA